MYYNTIINVMMSFNPPSGFSPPNFLLFRFFSSGARSCIGLRFRRPVPPAIGDHSHALRNLYSKLHTECLIKLQRLPRFIIEFDNLYSYNRMIYCWTAHFTVFFSNFWMNRFTCQHTSIFTNWTSTTLFSSAYYCLARTLQNILCPLCGDN